MRQLQQALRAFNGRGVLLRSEPKNKIILTGATDELSSSDMRVFKINKPLLILILPEGKDYAIEQILEALNRIIERSELLIIDAGYELHSADIRALPVGRAYLNTCIGSN